MGTTIPLFIGSVIFVTFTFVFAYAKTYSLLLIARVMQGIGSASNSIAGLTLIASLYKDEQRAQAFGIVIGALAIGSTVGPVYGGLLYEFTDRSMPFVILAVAGLCIGCLQIVVLQPKTELSKREPTSMIALIKDPYIILISGAITVANISFGALEPTLPIRMIEKINASRAEIGIIYVTSLVGYIIASSTSTYISELMPKWLMTISGLILVGLSLIMLKFTMTLVTISIPNLGYGFATGLVDISMMPVFSYIVDTRHTGTYGNVYALADLAWALAYAIGPVIGGALMDSVGFEWMLYIIALTCFLYAPLILFLRNLPAKIENTKVTENTPLITEQLKQ